jgi:DNA invertase Pin-like site-specific DNA recombinase
MDHLAVIGNSVRYAEQAEIIKERVKTGLARARAQGKRLGRRPVSGDVVERIREQLARGSGIIKTAKLIGCGVGTVHRIKKEMATVAA